MGLHLEDGEPLRLDGRVRVRTVGGLCCRLSVSCLFTMSAFCVAGLEPARPLAPTSFDVGGLRELRTLTPEMESVCAFSAASLAHNPSIHCLFTEVVLPLPSSGRRLRNEITHCWSSSGWQAASPQSRLTLPASQPTRNDKTAQTG
jgi:hypothetical protein